MITCYNYKKEKGDLKTMTIKDLLNSMKNVTQIKVEWYWENIKGLSIDEEYCYYGEINNEFEAWDKDYHNVYNWNIDDFEELKIVEQELYLKIVAEDYEDYNCRREREEQENERFMNGFTATAEHYRCLVRNGEIPAKEVERDIAIYDFLSGCNDTDFFKFIDSSAFNHIIKAFAKLSLRKANIDKATEDNIVRQLELIFDEMSSEDVVKEIENTLLP